MKSKRFHARACGQSLPVWLRQRRPGMTLLAGLLTMTILSTNVLAAPEGGVVAAGSSSISQVGKKTDIHQHTDRTIIDWRQFNLAKDEHVQFHQPSSSATALNRVNASRPSEIHGRLTANGNVIIINPNGVFFGPNSRVDVNSLLASSADIRNDDFMAGKMDFHLKGNSTAKIINEGTITAKEAGLVGLVAPHVENSGVIRAKMGTVQAKSGDTFTLDLYGDGLIKVAAIGDLKNQIVKNSGVIEANGGIVELTAAQARTNIDNMVVNTGTVEAQTVFRQHGVIVLGGEGTLVARQEGRLDVSGTRAHETGGRITVTGEQVTLKEGSQTVANGTVGGGTVQIGGAYQGQGDTYTSEVTTLEQGAVIQANALEAGPGGGVILWSDEQTRVAGRVEAKGGALSGDGGLIETSSKNKLNVTASAVLDATADNGQGGSWLLDPRNVFLRDAAGTDASGGGIVNVTGDDEVVDVNTIETALNNGLSVTVTTGATGAQDGDITVEDSIQKTAGGDASFTLQAARSIIIDNVDADGDTPNMTSTSGTLDLTLNADRDANQDGYVYVNAATLDSNGGDIVMGGGADPTTTAAWGNAVLDDGVFLDSSTLTAGTGNITLNGHGRDNAANSDQNGIHVLDSAVQTTTGSITFDGTGGAGEDTNMGVRISGSSALVTSVDGDISLIGQGGSSGAAGSIWNFGVYVVNGADITSTGTGANAATITLNGTGGAGEDSNFGTRVVSNGTLITSVDGDILIAGQGGGTGAADSNGNNGYYQDGGSDISSTGTGADAATITIDGTGGNGEDSNRGVFILNSGTTITSVDGNISITGRGGSNGSDISTDNYGIVVNDSSDIISTGTGSGAATITMSGTGGNGEITNYGIYGLNGGTLVTSVDGDISIIGQGGSNGTAGSSSNYGIYAVSGFDVTSTGTGANAATITIDGTGGLGDATNHGAYVTGTGTTVTSKDGEVSLVGKGGSNGTGDTNYGVFLNSNAKVQSTNIGADAATITIDGTGGLGDDRNLGVYIAAFAQATSVDGDISVIGKGGSAGSTANINNVGIHMHTGGKIQSTGTGANAAKISVDGTGAVGGNSNSGISLRWHTGTLITSVDGDISITGKGGGTSTTDHNYGLYMLQGADITSTGVGADAATITINGIGGNGDDNNRGVYMRDAGTQITSTDGDMFVTGQAGSNGGSGSNTNYGIYMDAGPDILSIGTGTEAATITLDGTGGNGEDFNLGFFIEDPGTLVRSVDGDLSISGRGGSRGATSSSNNYGIRVLADADIMSTGTGANAASITLNGTGGNGGPTNQGIRLNGAGVTVSTIDGDISMTGQGRSFTTGTDLNTGLNILGGSVVSSSGTGAGAGTITLQGTAAASRANNHGVVVQQANTAVTSVDGDISIVGTSNSDDLGGNVTNDGVVIVTDGDVKSTGAANITIQGTKGAGGDDIRVAGAGTTMEFGDAASTGDITFISDNFNMTNATVDTQGDITLKPRTASASIGVSGGAGTVDISDTILGFMHAGGSLIIGDRAAGTGDITVDNLDVTGGGYDLELYGGNVTIDNGLTGAGFIQLASATGTDITLNSVVTANGSGDAAVFVTGDEFINTVGPGVISAPSGHALVYAQDPTFITATGLTGDKQYNRDFLNDPPASLGLANNTFLYNHNAILTFTADNEIRDYAISNPAFTYDTAGLVFGDTLAAATGGGTSSVTTTAVQTSDVGAYAITMGAGTTTNPYNYNVVLNDGQLDIAPIQLTVQADNQSRLMSEPNPALTYNISGFANSQDESVFVTPLVVSTSATNLSGPGDYAITPLGATATNYTFNYVPGTLTITDSGSSSNNGFGSSSNSSISSSLQNIISDPTALVYSSTGFSFSGIQAKNMQSKPLTKQDWAFRTTVQDAPYPANIFDFQNRLFSITPGVAKNFAIAVHPNLEPSRY